MSHNYRIVKTVNPETQESWYAIHTVYYNEDGIMDLVGTVGASTYGETKEELLEDVELYMQALKKPIVEYNTLTGELTEEGNDMKTNYVELVERSTKKVLKRTAVRDDKSAKKICEGMDRNVDSSLYFSRIVKAEEGTHPLIY
jgi:hypothetical protein